MNALKAVPCFLEIEGFMYETHTGVQLRSNKHYPAFWKLFIFEKHFDLILLIDSI